MVLALSVSAIAFADGESDSSEPSTIPTIDCPICGKRFLNTTGDMQNYNDHLDSHKTWETDAVTGEMNGYYVCQECGRKFENPSAYIQDQNTHIGRTDYECAICHQKFSNQDLYNAHIKTHYNTVDHKWGQYVKLSLPELMDKFFGYMQTSGVMTTILDLFWDLYNRVMEYIVNGTAGSGAGEAEVAGAVDKLDLAIGKLNLPDFQLTGIRDFMTA
ncbi:MAG: C2H2-type zinc finger protein, partial [Clostridia bacterium]|nr:C2H2-type zinc finger protein [Clostridia bacterium]